MFARVILAERSGRVTKDCISSAQEMGSKAWMCWRRAAGDWSGEGVSGRKVEVKAIVGWGAVIGSVSWYHRVWTKKITSRR